MKMKNFLFAAAAAASVSYALMCAPATSQAATLPLPFLANTLNRQLPDLSATFPRPSSPNELWAVTYAGSLWPGQRGGPALWSLHHGATGMYLDDGGNMYLTNGGNDNVRLIDNTGTVSVYAGAYLPFPATKDGALDVATFSTPNDVKGDSLGFLYVCDREGHSIRRIDPQAGVVKRVAGKGYCQKGYDGEAVDATTVRLNLAQNMTIATKNTQWHDPDTIYFTDRGNMMIRKLILNPDGDTDPSNDTYSLYDVAGSPGPGYVDGAAADAKFNQPCGITLSNDEQYLLIDDRDNNIVRVIDLAAGEVGTYAGVKYQRTGPTGLGNQFADGPADQAYFASPSQCDIMGGGPIGDLIIADRFNQRIRKVTPLPPGQWPNGLPVADEVSTYAGTGEEGRRSGPADQARFLQPWGVLVDGNMVYISEPGGNRVVVIGKAKDVLSEFLDRIRAGRRAALQSFFQLYLDYFGGEQTFQPPFGTGENLP